MKKKIVSLLLTLALTFAIAPMAFASYEGDEMSDADFRALFSITNVVSESMCRLAWDLDTEILLVRTTAPTRITPAGGISAEINKATLIDNRIADVDFGEWIDCTNGEPVVLEAGAYMVYGDIDVGFAAFAIVVDGNTAPSTPAPSAKTVNPTASTVYVSGAAKAFEAYTIDGNNYFKLRDLALVLNGSNKQFEVGYDNNTKAITLTSGKSYTAVGGEMTQGDGKAKTATPTASRIYLDDKELNLTVYTINGNNFFKLRDLMKAIDVFVGYDNVTKAITVDTNRGYVDE